MTAQSASPTHIWFDNRTNGRKKLIYERPVKLMILSKCKRYARIQRIDNNEEWIVAVKDLTPVVPAL